MVSAEEMRRKTGNYYSGYFSINWRKRKKKIFGGK